MTDHDLVLALDGAYVEQDESGTRVYCRSPLDAVRARIVLDGLDQDEHLTVYGGHSESLEEDPDVDARIEEVLALRQVQQLMAFGFEVVSVSVVGEP